MRLWSQSIQDACAKRQFSKVLLWAVKIGGATADSCGLEEEEEEIKIENSWATAVARGFGCAALVH